MAAQAKPSPEGAEKILIVTTPTVVGYRIREVRGLVWASSVRSKFVLNELKAMVQVLRGGEVKEYWRLVNETRHDIVNQLNHNARKMGANAVVGVNMATAQVIPGAVEILGYGTAVVIEKE